MTVASWFLTELKAHCLDINLIFSFDSFVCVYELHVGVVYVCAHGRVNMPHSVYVTPHRVFVCVCMYV